LLGLGGGDRDRPVLAPERKIQTWLAAAPDCGERPLPGLVEFRDACGVVQRGASAISLCFLAAVVAMIWQPR
jgi:hypothetical protein